MIVVDSSALIAIIRDEPQADDCMAALLKADRTLMAAPTLTESLIVALGHAAEQPLRTMLERFGLEIMPLTETRAHAALDAYRRYGRRRHPAALNYGDTFAYALAREHDCPLLYVGDDFARTDVRSAIAE